MPPKEVDALSKRLVHELWSKALAHVTQEFSPKEHFPDKVYEFLEPTVSTTCQGYYTTLLMVAGSMAALTNGAAVKIWNQKPAPLVASVFRIRNVQAGKSRPFEECDDVIGEHVHTMLREGPPVILQNITFQSFTFTEIFYRCSSSFPLVAFSDGKERLTNFKQSEVGGGKAFNFDEAQEFWHGLGPQASGRGRGDKDRAPTVHASTLNTLIGGGKTRRATRTSTSFGESRGKRVSVSLLVNGHPANFMAPHTGHWTPDTRQPDTLENWRTGTTGQRDNQPDTGHQTLDTRHQTDRTPDNQTTGQMDNRTPDNRTTVQRKPDTRQPDTWHWTTGDN